MDWLDYPLLQWMMAADKTSTIIRFQTMMGSLCSIRSTLWLLRTTFSIDTGAAFCTIAERRKGRGCTQPLRRLLFHERSQPGRGPGHGPFGGILYDKARQHGRYLYFTEQPNARHVCPATVRIGLGVPNALGVLQNDIFAGLVEGEFHKVSIGMWHVLVYGGNVELEFTQYEISAGDTGVAVVSRFLARTRQ